MADGDADRTWSDRRHTAAVLVAVALLLLVPWLVPKIVDRTEADWQASWASVRLWTWIANVLIVLGAIAVLGHGVRGRWLGLLINRDNRMSLTQLQLILWTAIAVSGLFTAALSNLSVRLPAGDDAEAAAAGYRLPDWIERALDVAIPPELWLLLGINVASFAGSAILKQGKTKQNPTTPALERAGLTRILPRSDQAGFNVGIRRRAATGPEAQSEPPVLQSSSGVLLVNADASQASFGDLFNGAEVGNGAFLDVGKVQMFFFTVIAVLVYAVAVGYAFAARDHIPFTTFPDFGDEIATIIAISHAGYLVNLAAPHTETERT